MRSHYLFATVLCGPMSLCNVFWPFWLLFCFVFWFLESSANGGNTFPVHCQIWKGAKVQLFQGRKQFLITLPKVAPLHPGFSLYFLDAK